MDFEALRHGDFSQLKEAVSEWTEMISKLEKLEARATEQLEKRAKKADWSGYNASVTRDFVTQTAREFSDAVVQATTIRNILRDTSNELVGYQKSLESAVDGAHKKEIIIRDTGGGSFSVTEQSTSGEKIDPSELEAVKAEVERILGKATESDDSAAKALRALVDQAKHGFSDVSYNNRDSAVQALRAAERIAKMAEEPESMTPAQFDDMLSTLKKYSGDALFAERFATKLGARDTLAFWAELHDPNGNLELGQARHDEYGDLQKQLGLTLAHATQSDSPAMQQWEKNVISLGDKPIGTAPGSGFQITSSLMRFGDYEDGFLGRYGTALIDYEKSVTGNGTDAAAMWNSTHPTWNHTGSDTGLDPMAGFMKALSNSPMAATDFFNDTYVNTGENHEFTNENGGKRRVSIFEYLFEEREWPTDVNHEGEESVAGRNFLGHALEAATTGHPADTPPSAEHISHSPAQTSLFEEIVSSVSEDRNRLLGSGYMSDSFGQIAAEYMPDIHRSFDAKLDGEAKLYPVADSVARLGEEDVTRFLYALGRNPEGYAAVNIGQNNYTAALMEMHFKNPDAYISTPEFSDQEVINKAVGHIATRAGEIEGILAAGRAYQSELTEGASDAEYNEALSHLNTWGSSLAAIGTAVVAAPTGPGAIVAGGLASTVASEAIGSVTEGMVRDSSEQVIYRNSQAWADTRESTSILVEQAAQHAGKSSDRPYEFIADTASVSAENGFNNAATNIRNALEGEGVPRTIKEK